MQVGEAMKKFQIDCLLGAQDNLKKARSSGFPLPIDVAEGIQEIMSKIPVLIGRLEGGVVPPAGGGPRTPEPQVAAGVEQKTAA